jgi:hypothetical protein
MKLFLKSFVVVQFAIAAIKGDLEEVQCHQPSVKATQTIRSDDLPTPKGLNLIWRRVGIEGVRPPRGR